MDKIDYRKYKLSSYLAAVNYKNGKITREKMIEQVKEIHPNIYFTYHHNNCFKHNVEDFADFVEELTLRDLMQTFVGYCTPIISIEKH